MSRALYVVVAAILGCAAGVLCAYGLQSNQETTALKTAAQNILPQTPTILIREADIITIDLGAHTLLVSAVNPYANASSSELMLVTYDAQTRISDSSQRSIAPSALKVNGHISLGITRAHGPLHAVIITTY